MDEEGDQDVCTPEECHMHMEYLADMGMRADTNGDMAIDHHECGNMEDEFEGELCHAIIDHCDLDGDGAVHGCELLACIEIHA